MLGDGNAVATVGVRDIGKARAFYEGMLGLVLLENRDDQVITYKAGSSRLFVYHSEMAGSNRATGLTWLLRDGLDETVRDLRAKGVSFEHYEMPNTHLEGDVHVSDEMRVAWFKDPDGNIHAIASG